MSLDPPSATRRAVARLIDGLILSMVTGALGQLIGYGWAWLVGTALFVWLAFAACDALLGTTPGKALCGLRILAADGGPVTPQAALRREAFTLLGAIPIIGAVLAIIYWIVAGRAIAAGQLPPHDTFGGTRVGPANLG